MTALLYTLHTDVVNKAVESNENNANQQLREGLNQEGTRDSVPTKILLLWTHGLL